MDPAEASSRWHRWTVEGTESQIDHVFVTLNTNLPADWKRLTGKDLAPYESLVSQGSGWYATDPNPTQRRVVLSLERLKNSELRGGRVWFAGPPSPSSLSTFSLSTSWDQIIRLLDDGIVPAARAAGAIFRLPTVEEIFFAELPQDVRDRLLAFSDAARKSLPLNRRESKAWGEFVIAAFRSRTVVNAESFVNWLAARGWDLESAKELNRRFFDQCLLLSQFADEVLAV